jgi:hypothetical protein
VFSGLGPFPGSLFRGVSLRAIFASFRQPFGGLRARRQLQPTTIIWLPEFVQAIVLFFGGGRKGEIFTVYAIKELAVDSIVFARCDAVALARAFRCPVVDCGFVTGRMRTRCGFIDGRLVCRVLLGVARF